MRKQIPFLAILLLVFAVAPLSAGEQNLEQPSPRKWYCFEDWNSIIDINDAIEFDSMKFYCTPGLLDFNMRKWYCEDLPFLTPLARKWYCKKGDPLKVRKWYCANEERSYSQARKWYCKKGDPLKVRKWYCHNFDQAIRTYYAAPEVELLQQAIV